MPRVTGDAVDGSVHGFRKAVEDRGLGDAIGARTDQSACVGFRKARVRALWAEAPPRAGRRPRSGDGSQGPRLSGWAVTPANGPEPDSYGRRLPVRRSAADPLEIACFPCGGPPGTPPVDSVRVAGTRWAIEDRFALAQGGCGLDEHEVRRWAGRRRHVTFSLFAFAVLAAIRSRAERRPHKKGLSA